MAAIQVHRLGIKAIKQPTSPHAKYVRQEARSLPPDPFLMIHSFVNVEKWTEKKNMKFRKSL